MKKTALTFGLFSLVAVATSFANPTATNSSTDKGIDIFDTDGTGHGTSGRRKGDEFAQSKNVANSFNADRQFTRVTVKVD
ncbi:hypothetical protein [Flavobacterium sp. DG2-3]|uniref:hypothetical protein n=1 Tax=Flavobacterium sp. DG2-3 TaxID=3068317 RepID=UPI00273FEA38|nr:hypothetical protein [Flavobacterium sp. DG2-3]MDP5198202.1 hypothetical protein [Flavobacterium sp. DG2-3]